MCTCIRAYARPRQARTHSCVLGRSPNATVVNYTIEEAIQILKKKKKEEEEAIHMHMKREIKGPRQILLLSLCSAAEFPNLSFSNG